MTKLPLTKNGGISERLINSLPQPTEKPAIHWHPVFKGFGVIISAKKGTRSYICQRDINGRTRRVTLGAVGAISPEDALTQANSLIQSMRDGVDPRRNLPKASTVGRLMDQMIESKKDSLRKSTISNYRWLIEKYSDDWIKFPISSISPNDVMKRHIKLTKDIGPVSANNWAGIFRTLWNFADDLEIVSGRNPVEILKHQRLLNRKPVRDRVVPLDQVPDFLSKLEIVENTVQRAFLTFLMFTALRRNEAATLTWSDIKNDCVCIPGNRNKSGREFSIPLSSSARAAIAGLPKGIWLFPADSRSGHLEDPRKALAHTGYRVSCHDLRRTWASAAALVLPDAVRRRLLNHAPPSVTDRHYTVLDDPRQLVEFTESVDRLLNSGGLIKKPDHTA